MPFNERQHSRVCHDTVVVTLLERLYKILFLAEAQIPFLHQFFFHHKPGGSIDACRACAEEFLSAGVGRDLLMEDQDF